MSALDRGYVLKFLEIGARPCISVFKPKSTHINTIYRLPLDEGLTTLEASVEEAIRDFESRRKALIGNS